MIISKRQLSCFFALVSSIPMLTQADIFKCMQPDGTPLFHTECPEGTVKSEKVKVSEVSDLGFNNTAHSELAVGQEIISNGYFENQLDKWDVRGNAETQDREGIKGTTALRVYSDGAENNRIRLRQCLPVNGIEELSVSAFVKQEGALTPKANELRVISYTSDNCTTGGEYNAQLNPTAAPGWQKIQDTSVTPSLGAKSLLVEIIHENDSAEAAFALWDEVIVAVSKLESTVSSTAINSQFTRPRGENHIVNGDFASDLEYWQTGWASDWSQYGGQDISGGAHVVANSDFGEKIRGVALSQCVNFGSNKEFKVGVSFKKDSLSSEKGSAMMRLTWMEDANCAGKQQLGGSFLSVDTTGWQTLDGDVTSPDGSQSVLIRLYQTVENTGIYGAFWDNAYFIAK